VHHFASGIGIVEEMSALFCVRSTGCKAYVRGTTACLYSLPWVSLSLVGGRALIEPVSIATTCTAGLSNARSTTR
jgi:hypothetical protein